MKATLIYRDRDNMSIREHAFQGEKVGYTIPVTSQRHLPTFRVWDDKQTVVILLSALICLQVVEDE